MRTRWQGLVVLGLAALIGCSVGVRPGTVPARQADLEIAASPRTATLAIAIEDRGYHLSYLRELDWESATATLTNTNPAIASVSQTAPAAVNAATKARTANFSIAPVPVAGGYSLQIDLQRRNAAGTLQTVATGTNANFSVVAGPNPITVTLALNANGQLVVTVPNPTGSANQVSDLASTYSHFTLVRQAGGTTVGTALGTDPLSATFTQIGGIESDADGNLYVVDTGAHQVRLVPPAGPSSVLAGSATGSSGSSGDNGPATAALLNGPNGLVRDPATGVIYLCDTGNNRVRFVRPNGNISTIAGGGASVATTVTPATSAALSSPFDITGDAAGNVYFTESGNGRVRMLAPNGTLTTIATLVAPKTLAIDRTNKLLWVEDGAKVTLISNIDSTPVVSGTPVYTSTNSVVGLAFDGAGTLYIAEAKSPGTSAVRVLRQPVGTNGQAQSGRGPEVIAGTGSTSGTVANYYAPTAPLANALNQLMAGAGHMFLHLDLSSSNAPGVIGAPMYLGSNYTGQFAQVVQLDPRSPVDPTPTPVPPPTPTPPPTNGGATTTFAGNNASSGYADATGTAALFQQPKGVAADSAGNVYVADYGNSVIRKITPAGVVTTFAGLKGNYGVVDGNGAAARFDHPNAIAVDAGDNLYVAERSAIRKIDQAANVTTLAGSTNAGFADGTGAAAQFRYPGGLCVDGSGTVWVADSQNTRIRKVTPAGVVTTFAGSGNGGYRDGVGAGAQFRQPLGIAVDYLGNLFVADTQNHVIRKIAPDATVTTYAGSTRNGWTDGPRTSALFYRPANLTIDAGGTLYIADQYNNAIRKITAAGTVTTLDGIGGCCTSGVTDGTGSAALFDRPYGITILPNALIYVGDQNNNTIRKIQ